MFKVNGKELPADKFQELYNLTKTPYSLLNEAGIKKYNEGFKRALTEYHKVSGKNPNSTNKSPVERKKDIPKQKLTKKEPIKWNERLEWIADSVGNQDGNVNHSEKNYLEMKFKYSDNVYLLDKSDRKNGKLYNSIDEIKGAYPKRLNYGGIPLKILEFNREGQLNNQWQAPFYSSKKWSKLPRFLWSRSINYKADMQQRRNRR